MFEQESGTAAGVDLGTITERMEIRQAVQSGDVEGAIEKVNDMNPEVGTRVQHLSAKFGIHSDGHWRALQCSAAHAL